MNFLKFCLVAVPFFASSVSFGETPVETNFKEFFGTYKIVSCKSGGEEAPGSFFCHPYQNVKISFPDPWSHKNVYITKFKDLGDGIMGDTLGYDNLANNDCKLGLGTAECDNTERTWPEHYSTQIERISENRIRIKLQMTSYYWHYFNKIPTGYLHELILEKQSDKVCTRYGTATSCDY